MIDYASLSNEELTAIFNTITEERVKRYNKDKEEKWNDVVKALTEYVNKYGTIEVYAPDANSIAINRYFSYDTIGEINDPHY